MVERVGKKKVDQRRESKKASKSASLNRTSADNHDAIMGE